MAISVNSVKLGIPLEYPTAHNTGFPTLEDDASGSDASGIPKR